MRAIRWLAVLGVLAGLALAGRYWFLTTVHASLGYSVEARFGRLPAEDVPLCEWLKAQPGVVPGTVSIRREESDGTLLKVCFIQSRNLAGEPPFPDLEGACERLGYG